MNRDNRRPSGKMEVDRKIEGENGKEKTEEDPIFNQSWSSFPHLKIDLLPDHSELSGQYLGLHNTFVCLFRGTDTVCLLGKVGQAF